MRYIFLALYAIVAFICSSGRLLSDPFGQQIDWVSKPLLMPLLAGFVLFSASRAEIKKNKTLFIALLFAWLGDVLLILPYPACFLLGLGSFLVMQFNYIQLFSQQRAEELSLLKRRMYLILPFFIIAAIFYALALPQLNSTLLQVAVFFYALTLVAMTLTALNRFEGVKMASFLYVFIGACLFMTSDLLIGYNKFINPTPLADFYIMLTYTLAQGLIIVGYLKDPVVD